MTSVHQAKHQHNVQKWTQIIMEQRASGLSGLTYCRRAGINSKTFYYWQNVIQKELLASKVQYADVVETLSPSSEPLKPSKVEHETSAPKTPATSVEVAHETVEPPAESTPALPEPPESISQEEVHFVSLKCTRPSSWIRISQRSSCSAAVARTVSRACSGMRRGSCCSTNGQRESCPRLQMDS